MKIIILCSKHFYSQIPKIKEHLEKNKHKLKMPNSYDDPFKEEKMKKLSEKEHIIWKGEMLKKDEENISPQDAILVLNFEKNKIPNYIGGATFLEIYTAWRLNKKIFFYNPLPNCSFTDELIAMQPIILNGDLSRIK
ncbi:hypothetical protein GW932_03185 [archaeon]|nr:hypothetical protein [archaeon]